MESWEQDYINDHLSDLIKKTFCNTSLLSYLLEKRLITREEEEHLTNLESIPAARELYRVAETRQNGYKLLIEALHMSRQTGVASILLDAPHGVIPPDILLVEQAELLLDFNVEIWESTYKLREIFPKLSTQCLTEILRDSLINKEFRQLQNMSHPLLKLQTNTPPLRPFYIPRSISNRLLIRKELFKCKEVQDVFVFTGIGWKDLTELIKPHLLQSSTSQRWSITCRHIFLEHQDDWNDMFQRAKTPVHLINFDGENYVLQNSNRTTDILLKNSYRTDKLPYVTEDEFIEQISTERNGMLLCDVPGMGKTWLMESLAKKIQGVSADRFVFFIALPLLAELLEKRKTNTHCNNNLAFILEYACKSKLAKSICCASGNKKLMLVFVCDGFDEIMECSVEKTTSFLKDLRSNPNVKLLISSRPHIRKYLETTFELASFDILPFSSKQQTGFLVRHWRGMLGLDEQSVQLEEFASQCFKSLKILEGDPISKHLGTPLVCSLVAVINEENAQLLSASSLNTPLVVPESIIVNSISELYEMFVKFCLKNLTKDQQENIIDCHIYYALILLFPDVAAAYIRGKPSITCSLVLGRFGIISQDGDFLHRSFAEYFTGRFFAGFYKYVSAYETEITSLICGQFAHIFCLGHHSMLKCISYPYCVATGVQCPIVLHFMNAEFDQGFNEQTLTLSVKDLSQKHVQMLKSLICPYINEFLIVTVYLKLENLLSFYVNWIKILFTNDEERIAFVTRNTSLKTYSKLLCFAAKYGSPVAVNLLFSLYDNSEGNWLSSKFKRYKPRRKQESPLEAAIKENDIDMVECFYGKVFMKTDRLYNACLKTHNFGVNAINDEKILRIMDRVLPGGNEICRLTQDIMNECGDSAMSDLFNFNLNNACRLLIGLAYMRRMSLTSLDKMTKVKVSSTIMVIGDDETFLKTLLLLFHKDTLGKSSCPLDTVINNHQHLTELPADQILGLLNITPLKETLTDRYIIKNNVKFIIITGLETLKLLLAISPSFTDYDDYKRNYMHLAVHQDKLDWVVYLINLGHDLNQQDIRGKTPLLSVSTETEPEIVTCLVQNGADIYSVDNNGDNFLHFLFSPIYSKQSFSPPFFPTWINFIFKNKYTKLFEMKNSDGLTPISLVAQKYNGEADLVFSMYGASEFTPREVNAARLEKTILWYNDVELIKVLLKMFPVGANPHDSETDDLRQTSNSDEFAFHSDTVLQLIDVNNARETAQNVLITNFNAIRNTNSFQFMKRKETLKVILKIIPEFSCRNVEKLNYMHVSVAQGKVEWLEHLISLGHDVNQQDKWGKTPVFYLSEKNTIVIIRRLVENGANMCHVDCENTTFAHQFLYKHIPKDLVVEWTRYMLEIGAHDVWHICPRVDSVTPFKLLKFKLGGDHPTTKKVLAAARPRMKRIFINE